MSDALKLFGGIVIAVVLLAFILPFIFVYLIFAILAISVVFLVAMLTGLPIEVKRDDQVIGHLVRFKYIPANKDL